MWMPCQVVNCPTDFETTTNLGLSDEADDVFLFELCRAHANAIESGELYSLAADGSGGLKLGADATPEVVSWVVDPIGAKNPALTLNLGRKGQTEQTIHLQLDPIVARAIADATARPTT